MSTLIERLVHGLPERHSPVKTSFATDSKSLRAWLAQLPMANPGATARLLIGALREMNQLHIDPQQRLDALELLRAPIFQMVTTLDKQVLGDSFPLPPQKYQLGQLAQDFEHALAMGYCAVVHDLCAPVGVVPFLRGKVVAMALVRAVTHRGGCLHQVYLLYRVPPPGVWQNLHDLFRFAVAVHADTRAIADPLQNGAQVSVRMAYIHALLFALSNPYRFSQRENSEIYALTRIWSEHCELREGRAPAGAIAVRTDRDQSLGYLPEEREAPGEGLWALEISGLTRFLEGQLAMLPPGIVALQFRLRDGALVHADAGFVERLMSVWDGGAERSQQRLAAGHRLDTVIGLHDLHFVLAGDTDFESFVRKHRGLAISLHENDAVASWANNGHVAQPVRHLSAKVLDQSLGGYRLIWENLEGMRIKVGELLGLATPAEDDESQDWMIGVIRWLRIGATSTIDTGVELLARRALPVAVRSFDAHGVPRTAMRGVLLDPLDGSHDQQIRIIVPHLFDRGTSEMELTRPGDPFGWPAEAQVETISGVRVIDNGGGYLRLEIEPPATADAEPGEATAPATLAANDDPDAHTGGGPALGRR